MRSVSRRRASDYVRPALSEARVNRMWAAISAAEGTAGPSWTDRLARRGRVVALLAAAALAALLVIGVRRWPPSRPAMTGLLIDTGASTQEVSLAEGSTLSLAAATRLRVLSATDGEIRLRLERGGVVCDVVHREGRRFIVEAGGVEVEDRGTRFDVEVHPGAAEDAVAVRVERGAVEVHDATRAVVATLKPGQAWKSESVEAIPAIPDEPPARPDPPAPASAPAPPAPSARALPTRSDALSGPALFARADAARLAGRHADAAADFERFYRRFPADPRAGLAAYELGRIRLGSLRDPRGAAEAFGAVLERPDDPFREDAEAGRVEALADLGDETACRSARDAFRARYPRSPQAGRVAKLCGRP